eukprot:10591133-Alexandrium_andersonii.AAC.1
MSASLVGSEMCIRDSPGVDSGVWCHPVPRSAVSHAHACCPPGASLALGCLLYTSDAADDM